MNNKSLFVLLFIILVNQLSYAQKAGTARYDFSPIHNKIKTWIDLPVLTRDVLNDAVHTKRN